MTVADPASRSYSRRAVLMSESSGNLAVDEGNDRRLQTTDDCNSAGQRHQRMRTAGLHHSGTIGPSPDGSTNPSSSQV